MTKMTKMEELVSFRFQSVRCNETPATATIQQLKQTPTPAVALDPKDDGTTTASSTALPKPTHSSRHPPIPAAAALTTDQAAAGVSVTFQNLKLYGRENELEELKKAFHRSCRRRRGGTGDGGGVSSFGDGGSVATTRSYRKDDMDDWLQPQQQQQHRMEFTILTGVSGSGKSALARALRPLVEQRHGGFFVSGKFDPVVLDQPVIPYHPIIQAFTHWTHLVVQKNIKNSPETMHEIQAALKKISESDRMLMDLIPALRTLLSSLNENREHDKDKCDSSTDTSSRTQTPKTTTTPCANHQSSQGAGAQERLVFAFRQLVRAICSPDRPLILFLDDLQWADPASITVLSALVSDSSIQGLMVLGACRDNQVSMNHFLSVTLRELEANDVHICEIRIGKINQEAVSNMLSDVMQQQVSVDECSDLARRIWEKTKGNIFLIVQLIRSLVEDIENDTEEFSTSSTSSLSTSSSSSSSKRLETALQHKLDDDQPLNLVASQMYRLPKDVQDVLMLAACLGAEFHEHILAVIAPKDVSDKLSLAHSKGFVIRQQDGSWRFSHDQIHESAYALIPDHELAEVHLRIGRKLWKSLARDRIPDHYFLVIRQLSFGAHLMTDPAERHQMALLLLRAGEEATKSSAFVTAASYFQLGISMLSLRHWRDEYELSLGLYNAAAEVAYCNGTFELLEKFVEEVVKNARAVPDKLRALTCLVYALGSQSQLQRAIDLGMYTLKEIGESCPSNPGMVTVLWEWTKTKRMLQRLSDDDILRLPQATDPMKLAALRIMCLLFLPGMHTRPALACVLACRVARSLVVDGLSAFSCNGLNMLSVLCCCALNEIELGVRWSRLSLILLDRFDGQEWLARMYSGSYGICFVHINPLRDQLKPLMKAHRAGLRGGDVDASMLAAACYSTLALHAGLPLGPLCSDTTAFFELAKLHGQKNTMSLIRPSLQLILNLMGRSANPSELDGDAMTYREAMEDAVSTRNSQVVTLLMYARLMILIYFGRYDDALEVSMALRKQDTSRFPVHIRGSRYLYEGIAILGSKHRSQRRLMWIVRRNIQSLRTLASRSPNNTFVGKMHLLEAEQAASKGKIDYALISYDQAIACARENGVYSKIGLSSERAAMALKRHGRRIQSMRYFEQAVEAYEAWGATAKVNELKPTEN